MGIFICVFELFFYSFSIGLRKLKSTVYPTHVYFSGAQDGPGARLTHLTCEEVKSLVSNKESDVFHGNLVASMEVRITTILLFSLMYIFIAERHAYVDLRVENIRFYRGTSSISFEYQHWGL